MADDFTDRGLGWVESPPDDRDWPLELAYATLGVDAPDALPASYHVPAPLYPVLDQGSSPMCVAYSAAGEQGWYDLRDQGLALFDEAAFFRAIGGTASGAVIRDALARRLTVGYPVDGHPELAPRHRIAAYYSVPVTRADLCAAILSFGPVVIGTPWASSWFRPVGGVLPPFDTAVGGHAIQAVGWDAAGLRLRNSWGADWGDGGEATLPWGQLGHLREAWKAVDVIDPRPTVRVYSVLFAANASVRVARIEGGRIAGWDSDPWGESASSARCGRPQVLLGKYHGQATVVLVRAGHYRDHYVHVSAREGVTVVSHLVDAVAQEDTQP